VAAGAAHAFSGAALGAAAGRRQKRCVPTGPGVATSDVAVTPDRRAIWTADTHLASITKHGRALGRGNSVDVGGAPVAIAISRDGRHAAVTTGFYDRPGLAILDLKGHHVERADVGPEPCSVAITPDGESAYVTGAGVDGTLTRVDMRHGSVHPALAVGRHPRGLAITPDGERALVAVNGGASIVVIDLEASKVIGRIKTLPFPRNVAVSPDGERALVTHNGFQSHHVTVIDLRRQRAIERVGVGPDPAGIEFTKSGSRALVAASGSGKATVLDGRSGRRLRSIKLGGSPTSVTVAGGTAFVADRVSGQLHRVRIERGA
jgi:DNA-binding beta-propeller fold protein YncE